MKTKGALLIATLIAAATVAVLITFTRRNEPQKLQATAKRPVVQPAQVVRQEPAPTTSHPAEPTLVETSSVENTQAPAGTQPGRQTAAAPNPSQNQNVPSGEVREDPLARVALSLVGTGDPGAEAYWMNSIFDQSLSDQEREDLMEDLNEEGLSDPRHPGQRDLPLIVNRLAIIEDVAPYADPFMLEHLGEAYKDLVGLLNGIPPQ